MAIRSRRPLQCLSCPPHARARPAP
jgi:hypothetical protein